MREKARAYLVRFFMVLAMMVCMFVMLPMAYGSSFNKITKPINITLKGQSSGTESDFKAWSNIPPWCNTTDFAKKLVILKEYLAVVTNLPGDLVLLISTYHISSDEQWQTNSWSASVSFPNRPIEAVHESCDGTYIASETMQKHGSNTTNLQIWRTAPHGLIVDLNIIKPPLSTAFAFIPDTSECLFIDRGSVHFCDIASQKTRLANYLPTPVNCIAVAPDGKSLALVNCNFISIWDMKAEKMLIKWPSPGRAMTERLWYANHNKLISWSPMLIGVWDIMVKKNIFFNHQDLRNI